MAQPEMAQCCDICKCNAPVYAKAAYKVIPGWECEASATGQFKSEKE
jgi:hypothetical protein